jgi:hypothetical protein
MEDLAVMAQPEDGGWGGSTGIAAHSRPRYCTRRLGALGHHARTIVLDQHALDAGDCGDENRGRHPMSSKPKVRRIPWAI